MWISRSVEVFMVMNHHVEHVRIKALHSLQRLKSQERMLPHDRDLFPLERAGLFQESNRDPGLAYIVKQTCERQFPLVRARKPEMLAECHGNAGDQKAMLVRQAVMSAHDIDPAYEPLSLNMGDDRLAGRLDHFQIDRGSSGGRSEDALQCPDPSRDP